jgi:hypothetical protein
LIGIFWEESLFNNVFQGGGGTGVGFGQVEPAEFWRLKEYGFTPPPTVKIGEKTASTRALTDREAVLAAAALLGYAGYQWAMANPTIAKPTAEERLAIVAGWEACEVKLEDVRPFRRHTRAEEIVILDGLNLARGFKARREELRPLLFEASHYS